uniref:Uncharacterized protein n=1 Tax=Trypanosoma vivax (strain Y486) TaxID=1055687 RepID=G0U7A9_TRYVY|nr:conserved hypothetical protein [Trypanosoma vivax Y486]
MFRSLSRIYRTYCSGRVLDLTPKIADTRDVRYYEMSRATRVEFLVEERVIVDDRHYKLDESLSNAEQGERRKAMTLDFMVNNDHNWVGSSVTFGVIERKEMEAPGFSKHDTVVIRNELMNLEERKAREILSIAAKYVKSNGYVLLMDFGVSSSPLLASFARMLKQVSGSSMHLTHDYRKWISEENLYLVAEERRCLLGCHYAIALQLRL